MSVIFCQKKHESQNLDNDYCNTYKAENQEISLQSRNYSDFQIESSIIIA